MPGSLYRSDCEPLFDGMSYDLRKNCRNTKPIAELVSLVMDDSGEPAMVEGPGVVFVPIENVEGAAKALKKQLREVVNEGGVPVEEWRSSPPTVGSLTTWLAPPSPVRRL